MFQYPYPEWDKVLWAVCIAVEFILETLGLVRPKDATLTALIKDTIPVWARAMLVGWLFWHFVIEKSPGQ